MNNNNYCGVYMIKNDVDNRLYIGIAEDIGMRWATHMSLLQSGKHPSVYLQMAVKEYGIDNFTFTILCECSKDKLYEMEQYYIFCLDTVNPEVGYNRQYGGQTNRPCSATKRLMSESHKGKKHSEETKRKISETMRKRNKKK